MPRLMEEKDWMQTLTDVGAAEFLKAFCEERQ